MSAINEGMAGNELLQGAFSALSNWTTLEQGLEGRL